MGKRKGNHRRGNSSNSTSVKNLEGYILHAQLSDLDILEDLITLRKQDLLAKKHATRFPIYQHVQKRLDHTEQAIRRLVVQQTHLECPVELTPGFLYDYFQDYPSDTYFELYTDWKQIIKQLSELQEKIGMIVLTTNQIKKAGFDVLKVKYSQRSISTYLYLPLEQADAFKIVFGKKYDMARLNDLLISYAPEDANSFSVRISDHMSGAFYNQKKHQNQDYHRADVDIFI